jgi:hypothetical protein
LKKISRNCCDFSKLILKINDDILPKIVGSDAALYILFLKYCGNYFFFITVINIFVAIVYFFGENSDMNCGPNDFKNEFKVDQKSLLFKLSICNLNNDNYTLILIIYSLSLVVCLCFTTVMIFSYITKFMPNSKIIKYLTSYE